MPLDIRRLTETLPWSDDLFFQDDLVIPDLSQSVFPKVTVLLTVMNVNEDGNKGQMIAEVGQALSKLDFRDNQPLRVQHVLQTGKRIKRVSRCSFTLAFERNKQQSQSIESQKDRQNFPVIICSFIL